MHHDPIWATRKPQRRGEYLSGVPNRDLTLADYEQLDPAQREDVRQSGLWEVRPVGEVRAEHKGEPAPAPAGEPEGAAAEAGGGRRGRRSSSEAEGKE